MKKKRFSFAASRLAPDTASQDDVCKLQALLSQYGYLTGVCTPWLL